MDKEDQRKNRDRDKESRREKEKERENPHSEFVTGYAGAREWEEAMAKMLRGKGVPPCIRRSQGKSGMCMRIGYMINELRRCQLLWCLWIRLMCSISFQWVKYDCEKTKDEPMDIDSKVTPGVQAETPEEGEI